MVIMTSIYVTRDRLSSLFDEVKVIALRMGS